MSERGPISLGDIARVLARLQPQGAYTWNSILEMLGLPLWVEATAAARADKEETKKLHQEAIRVEGLPDVMKRPPPEEAAPTQAAFAPGDEIEVSQAGSVVAPPGWTKPGRIRGDVSDSAASAVEAPPLFIPLQERAMLTATALALSETGELDEERVVELIGSGKPLDRIPLRLRPTSGFGVQLLVDRGQRMQPFREDQRRIVTGLQSTVGAHRVEVLRFADFPATAGSGTRRTWRPYHPPPAGTAVLVLSDLGLGWHSSASRSHSTAEWVAWARRVRSAGARTVGLVPHGPRHWPAALRLQMTLVHWDRPTTVGTIRRTAAPSSVWRP